MQGMRRYLALVVCVLTFIGVFAGAAYGVNGEAAGRMNVNIASKQELAWFLLRNGVGRPAQAADEIIAYRRQNGPFSDIEEIRNIESIGEFEFDRILRWVKVSGRSDYRPAEDESGPGYPYPSRPSPRNGPSRGDVPPHDDPYGPWRMRP